MSRYTLLRGLWGAGLPLLSLGLTALLAAPGCEAGGAAADEPAQTAGPAAADGPEVEAPSLQLLQVDSGGEQDEVVVDLHYARPAAAPGPRLMELRLAYPPELLALQDSAPLQSAAAADKRLVVQQESGSLRLILLSTTNLATLEPGPLARLRFQRLAAGPATLALVERGPVFAPAEADQGLVLGDPLVIGGR